MTSQEAQLTGTDGPGVAAPTLPESPFEALRVAAGMLLGEPDFEAIIGHPRGKLMLHNAWLHGAGVVWGLPVHHDPSLGLVVGPGLAVDGWGRELRLEWSRHEELTGWVSQWLEDHPSSGTIDPDCAEHRTVKAWAVLEYYACPERKVLALADPCDVTRGHDAYSRIVERARVRIVDEPPRWWPSGYHRVRMLLGLEEASDVAGSDAQQAAREVAGKPPQLRARELLAQVRRLAAKDVTTMHPVRLSTGDYDLHPVAVTEAPVVIAALDIDAVVSEDCVRIADVQVDPWVRRALMPTLTIQELTCGLAPGLLGATTREDAGGPRVKGKLHWSRRHRRLAFWLTVPAAAGSQEDAVEITSLSERGRGWSTAQNREIRLEEDGRRVVVDLDQAPSYETVRVVVRGTGRSPLFGHSPHVPFAGLQDGPAGTVHEGHDAVFVEHIDRHDHGDHHHGDQQGDDSGSED
jgi:hypothetical protein